MQSEEGYIALWRHRDALGPHRVYSRYLDFFAGGQLRQLDLAGQPRRLHGLAAAGADGVAPASHLGRLEVDIIAKWAGNVLNRHLVDVMKV